MSRWGKPKKNQRRIDPRHHLEETADRKQDLLQEDRAIDASLQGMYDQYIAAHGSPPSRNLQQAWLTGPSAGVDRGPRPGPGRPFENPWSTGWGQGPQGGARNPPSSGPSVEGALRTGLENTAEEAIKVGGKNIFKPLGPGLDFYDTYSLAAGGDSGQAFQTAAGGFGDLGGALAGAKLGAAYGPWGVLGGAIIGGMGGDQAMRAVPGMDTAVDMYDNYGFWNTLGRGAEEIPEAYFTQTLPGMTQKFLWDQGTAALSDLGDWASDRAGELSDRAGELADWGSEQWDDFSDTASTAAAAAVEPATTARDVYSNYGVGGTLSRGAEEAGEVISDTAESFRSGDMFGDTGRSIANSSYNPFSRNFALYEGKNMKNNKKGDLLTESQISRMQKLSGIKTPKRPLLKEDIGVAGTVALVIWAIVHTELSMLRPQWPSGQPGKGIVTPIIKSAWERLKAMAQKRSQEGDPSLEAVVDGVEQDGSRALQSSGLSDEQIAMIQEKFAEDEQVATLLAQLAEAPPETYQQILAQLEQHIKSKLQ